MDSGYHVKLSLQLAAAVATGIATAQALAAAGPLTLNGSLVAAGVAVFDVPRRVAISTVGDSSGINFTVTGTNRQGRSITQTIKGPGTGLTVATTYDFKTVTSIVSSAAATGNVTAGTNATAASAPYVIDRIANPSIISAYLVSGAGDTSTVEVSYDDLTPYWDTEDPANPVTWSNPTITANNIAGPITMIRLAQSAGTALSSLTVTTPLKAGRV